LILERIVLARRRDTFAAALASLRLRAARGEFVPGRSVVVVDEARRLRMSHTPVREALACLCGEGLIERSPSEGFLYPRLDVAVVRDRLRFRSTLLQMSVEVRALAGAGPGREALSPVTALHQELARLVRAHGDAAVYDAYRRVSGQLAPLRTAERRILPDGEAEASALLAVLSTGDRSDRLSALEAYHARRIEAAPRLLLDLEGDRLFHPGKG